MTSHRVRPLLLDLFCGAGGAAAGYERAGFDVIGIDLADQPNYPYPFIRTDALTVSMLRRFDAVHASPPCQHASTIAKQQRTRRPDTYDHPNLIPPTRELLQASGLPYVIENVVGAELVEPVRLCGSWFGLDLHRHRLFECSFPILSTPCSHHWQEPRFRSLDKRRTALASVVGVHGHINYAGERQIREKAMDVDWMTPDELAEAIPPAYTEHIGAQLLEHLRAAA